MKHQKSRPPVANRSRDTHQGLVLSGLLMLIIAALLIPQMSLAQETADNGVLDLPLFPGAGDTNRPQPSPSQMLNIREQMKDKLELEVKELKTLSREQLLARAKDGERAAQLVLAADFADEANNRSFTVGAANAALIDAIYWFSLAASRGFPGAPPVDNVLPVPPLRVIRQPR